MIPLDYIKRHLRIESSEEDEIIETISQAAFHAILSHINRSEDSLFDDYACIPPSISVATAMLTGTLLEHREATANVQLNTNPFILTLLRPYKRIIPIANT